MFRLFIFSFLFCFSLNVFSQKKELILNPIVGKVYRTNAYPPYPEISSPITIPDSLKLKYYKFFYITIAPLEEYFRKYKSGEITYDKFETVLKNRTRKHIDTAIFAERVKKFPRIIYHIASGVELNGDKVFLIDANGDNKISKDEIIVYGKDVVDTLKENRTKTDLMKSVNFSQTGTDGSKRMISIKIRPIPYYTLESYKTEDERETSFGLIQNYYWTAETKLFNKDLQVYAEPNDFFNELGDYKFTYKTDTTVNRIPIDLNDEWADQTFSLNGDSLKKISGNRLKLFISYQSPPRSHNDTTFKISLKSTKTSEPVMLSSFLHGGKYILVDYWGTWCVPCIEKIPELQAINQDFSQKLTMISIAYDYDFETVRKFETEHNTNWPSFFIDRNGDQRLIKTLKVSIYPTFRLYNEKGELVMEGNTSATLNQIKDKISKSRF